jgi:hypothetical protein
VAGAGQYVPFGRINVFFLFVLVSGLTSYA